MWSHLEGPNPQWTVEAVGENPVVLFHVPHAGLQIPPDVRADIILDDKDLEAELLVMTDWHTDEIARRAAGLCGVDSVSFINQLSRLVVDPERLPDDVERALWLTMKVASGSTTPELVEAALESRVAGGTVTDGAEALVALAGLPQVVAGEEAAGGELRAGFVLRGEPSRDGDEVAVQLDAQLGGLARVVQLRDGRLREFMCFWRVDA